MKTLYSKYPGQCSTCGEAFGKGTFIKWEGRGRASHFCCPRNEPANQVAPCWECKDPNGRFRSYGAATPVYCDSCEAKIRAANPGIMASVYKNTDARSQEDYPCSDMGYEDQCAAACGL